MSEVTNGPQIRVEPDPIRGNHWVDKDGIPGGGVCAGFGVCIIWQNGPISVNGRNGASVEDVLFAAMDRLEFFQDTKFASVPVAQALMQLKKAVNKLNQPPEVEGKNNGAG